MGYGPTDGPTDRRSDRWTDRRTDGPTDRWTDGPSYGKRLEIHYFKSRISLKPSLLKAEFTIHIQLNKPCNYIKQGRILGIRCVSQASERRRYGPTDGPTDGRTDGRTDGPSYRGASQHLIKLLNPCRLSSWRICVCMRACVCVLPSRFRYLVNFTRTFEYMRVQGCVCACVCIKRVPGSSQIHSDIISDEKKHFCEFLENTWQTDRRTDPLIEMRGGI